jgi:hypothetical protein
MRQRFIFYLVVLLLMFSGEIFGQAVAENIGGKQDMGRFPKIIPASKPGYRIVMGKASLPPYRIGSGILIKFPIDYEALKKFDFEKQLRIDFRTSDLLTGKPKPSFSLLPKPVLESCFYASHLGYFCQKELQIQKLTSLPIHFRLGSMDYVNYMEQKPNAVKPQ